MLEDRGVQNMQSLVKLEVQVHEALALLETSIPRAELVMMIHLMGHLPHQIQKFGPLRHSWMFPLESFFGVLKRSIEYRKIPEAAIMTRYCLMQTLQRLSQALESSKERESRPSENLQQTSQHGYKIPTSCRSRQYTLSFQELQRVQQYLAEHDPAYPVLKR